MWSIWMGVCVCVCKCDLTCDAGSSVAVETYLPWRQSSTGEEWIMDQGKMGASAERSDLWAIQRKELRNRSVSGFVTDTSVPYPAFFY